MNRIVLAVLLALTSAPAAGAQFKSAMLKDLDETAARALVPVVKGIRAEPATLTIRVGQTVQLRLINVVVFDSTGADRGRLSGYDFRIPGGSAAVAVPRQITGKRVGKAVLTIHYPTTAWKGRQDPRPAATVTIDVKP